MNALKNYHNHYSVIDALKEATGEPTTKVTINTVVAVIPLPDLYYYLKKSNKTKKTTNKK